MTQKQTVEGGEKTNGVTMTESEYKAAKELNDRLSKIEANTSVKRQVVVGTAVALGAGGVVLAGTAIGKWLFGGPKVVPAVPVAPV